MVLGESQAVLHESVADNYFLLGADCEHVLETALAHFTPLHCVFALHTASWLSTHRAVRFALLQFARLAHRNPLLVLRLCLEQGDALETHRGVRRRPERFGRIAVFLQVLHHGLHLFGCVFGERSLSEKWASQVLSLRCPVEVERSPLQGAVRRYTQPCYAFTSLPGSAQRSQPLCLPRECCGDAGCHRPTRVGTDILDSLVVLVCRGLLLSQQHLSSLAVRVG
mmetsp:Transcript_27682/g.54518  ORF Transcript_27682/g.54518 Transcript_27682/m.54518 type:complete len:224 (-) Transcript_27682:648-1319(-)